MAIMLETSFFYLFEKILIMQSLLNHVISKKYYDSLTARDGHKFWTTGVVKRTQ